MQVNFTIHAYSEAATAYTTWIHNLNVKQKRYNKKKCIVWHNCGGIMRWSIPVRFYPGDKYFLGTCILQFISLPLFTWSRRKETQSGLNMYFSSSIPVLGWYILWNNFKIKALQRYSNGSHLNNPFSTRYDEISTLFSEHKNGPIRFALFLTFGCQSLAKGPLQCKHNKESERS